MGRRFFTVRRNPNYAAILVSSYLDRSIHKLQHLHPKVHSKFRSACASDLIISNTVSVCFLSPTDAFIFCRLRADGSGQSLMHMKSIILLFPKNLSKIMRNNIMHIPILSFSFLKLISLMTHFTEPALVLPVSVKFVHASDATN